MIDWAEKARYLSTCCAIVRDWTGRLFTLAGALLCWVITSLGQRPTADTMCRLRQHCTNWMDFIAGIHTLLQEVGIWQSFTYRHRFRLPSEPHGTFYKVGPTTRRLSTKRRIARYADAIRPAQTVCSTAAFLCPNTLYAPRFLQILYQAADLLC